MSKEYSIAVAILLGAVLKGFGIEIENSLLEATVVGLGAILIAIFRYRKGDISVAGIKK